MEKAMAMKHQMRAALFGACMVLAMATGSARAQEVPVVTGDHWTKSTPDVKKAYLVGIVNTVQVESAFQGATPAPDTQSIIPRLVKGMKGKTLDDVREGLDKWYAANPARIQRPVIETIWFEMVVPGLK
jgi:hypothetical protein